MFQEEKHLLRPLPVRLNGDHQEYLRRLVEGEYLQRRQRSIERRIKAARFPVIKTIDQFLWDWPKKINRLQIQNLFRLEFISQKANVIFLGTTGLGKTHFGIALGYAACLEGHSVLFADAIGVVNELTAAQQAGNLKRAIKQYLLPRVLVLDELGYLAVNQHGADLLFQVISQRYERGSMILTSNKPFKEWASTFANDSTITSAVLARRAKAMQSLETWPETYAAELRAMAEASGMDPAALAYGNSFLDLGGVRAGCRSAVVISDESVLHGHNLDWDTLGGLGRWTTCIVRRDPTDRRFRTVAIGFPGMIGALDIINEKGLALSFNQLGWGRGDATEPVFIMIRRIAETCGSLAEARQQLINAPAGMPFIITFPMPRTVPPLSSNAPATSSLRARSRTTGQPPVTHPREPKSALRCWTRL